MPPKTIYKPGENIFESSCDAITNAVNCVGVMGGGLALAFKKRYADTDYLKFYIEDCKSGDLKPGRVTAFWVDGQFIFNFPTKDHHANDSLYEYISSGMTAMIPMVEDLGLTSVALPMLGCGLGGLRWEVVHGIITKAIADTDITWELYGEKPID